MAGIANGGALLQLYNALNRTNYEDASLLQVVTIESAVYVVMKNDLAFIIAGTLNLYEHQSSVNPNMPVRFLIYLAQEYRFQHRTVLCFTMVARINSKGTEY